MLSFEVTNNQKDQLQKRFEWAAAYLDLSNLRMKKLCEYIKTIKSEYKKHTTTMPQLKPSNFKKFIPDPSQLVAPGIPGCHTERLEILGRMTGQIISELDSFSLFMDGAIMTPLLDFIFKSEEILKQIVTKYNEYSKYRHNTKETAKAVFKEYQNANTAAEKAYKDSLSASKTGKQDKIEKANKTLKDACMNYQKSVSNLRTAVAKFNTAHHNYADFIEDAIERMNKLHPERINLITSLINTCLIPSCNTLVNNSRDVKIWFEQSAIPWKIHFKQFIEAKGIVRMIIKPKDFVPISLPFADQSNFDVVAAPLTQIDAPLFIANVISDFTAAHPFEMNLTAGTKVFLYDNLEHDWVLAKDPMGQKRYVPSSCLQIEKMSLALVRTAQLSTTSDFLEVETGELLAVVGEDDSYYTCENIKGERGKVSKFAVFLEKQ